MGWIAMLNLSLPLKKLLKEIEASGAFFNQDDIYTYDVELIILGGSVRHAWPYFSKTMWQQIKTFAFKRSIERLKIEISELQNSGILGAAALHYDFI